MTNKYINAIKDGINSIKRGIKPNRNYVQKSKSIGKTQYLGRRIASAIGIYFLRNGVYRRPDVMLGMLPLYTVQSLDISRSLEKLEYRSVHGEFLAHQQGGRLGIRIDADLIGSGAPLTLALLRMYSLAQNEQLVDRKDEIDDKTGDPIKDGSENKDGEIRYNKINDDRHYVTTVPKNVIPKPDDVFTIYESSLSSGSNSEYKRSVEYKHKYEDLDKVDEDESIKEKIRDRRSGSSNTYDDYVMTNDISYEKIPYHNTFTFSHEDFIVFDCFIETLSWKREVRDGKSVINVIIMLREYIPPPIVESTKEVNLRKSIDMRKNVAGVKMKRVRYKKRINGDQITKNIRTSEMIDLLVNAGYRTANWHLRYNGLYYTQSNQLIKSNGNMYRFITDMNFKKFGKKNLGELRPLKV